MNQVLGIDVGYGAVKGISSRENKVYFPSQIASFKPVKFVTGMSNTPYVDRMAILHQDKYFVGASAGKQALANATIERSRTVTQEGKILLLSAIGNLIEHSPESINLVVGLPISNFDLRESYIGMAAGKHQFTMLNIDGSINKDMTVTVENIKCLPQPFGSLFDAVLDNKGEFIASSVAKGRVGIIDIGYRTTDYLRSENLEYLSKYSTSFDEMGGYKIASTLSDLIYDEHQVRIPVEDIDRYVRGADLLINGELVRIGDLRKKAFKISAEAILARALSIWPDIKLLELIVITGGTAHLIGEYLKERLGKTAIITQEPEFANCYGYRKFGLRAWGK